VKRSFKLKTDLKKIKSLQKQFEFFKKEFMNNIASDFLENIKHKAKDEYYAENLELAKIHGSDDLAIVVTEKGLKIKKVEQGVFYYRPTSKVIESSKTYLALKTYEPYVKELLPFKVDPRFKLVFKKLSDSEYSFFTSEQAINEYLNNELPQIKKSLILAGENISSILNRNEVDPDLLIFEDLEFITLRKELGIRIKEDAKWIPAIQETREPSYLEYALKEASKVLEEKKNFVDISRGFAKISSDTAMDISDFEKKIFGRIK